MFKNLEIIQIQRMDNIIVAGHVDTYNGIGIRIVEEDGTRVTVPWHNIAQIDQPLFDDDDLMEDDDEPTAYKDLPEKFKVVYQDGKLIIDGKQIWPI